MSIFQHLFQIEILAAIIPQLPEFFIGAMLIPPTYLSFVG
jgi:hypothetical protein